MMAKTILLVDDAETILLFEQTMLQGMGYLLRVARNGQEAIDIWEEWRQHLIWMDMRMPVLDGYEATKHIRRAEEQKSRLIDNQRAEKSKTPHTIIIAVTASSFEEERAKILATGCDDYLRKPFRETELFELMSKHIGVKFVYEEEGQETQGAKQKAEGVVMPEALAALPAEWIAQLRQGAAEVDIDRLSAMIEQIRERDAALADALTCLAEDFEYDEILALIQERT